VYIVIDLKCRADSLTNLRTIKYILLWFLYKFEYILGAVLNYCEAFPQWLSVRKSLYVILWFYQRRTMYYLLLRKSSKSDLEYRKIFDTFSFWSVLCWWFDTTTLYWLTLSTIYFLLLLVSYFCSSRLSISEFKLLFFLAYLQQRYFT
jgi:hypothetical protein